MLPGLPAGPLQLMGVSLHHAGVPGKLPLKTVIAVVPCLMVGLTKYIQLVSNNYKGTLLLLAALHLPRVKLRFLSCSGRNKDRCLKNKPQKEGGCSPPWLKGCCEGSLQPCPEGGTEGTGAGCVGLLGGQG